MRFSFPSRTAVNRGSLTRFQGIYSCSPRHIAVEKLSTPATIRSRKCVEVQVSMLRSRKYTWRMSHGRSRHHSWNIGPESPSVLYGADKTVWWSYKYEFGPSRLTYRVSPTTSAPIYVSAHGAISPYQPENASINLHRIKHTCCSGGSHPVLSVCML